MHAVTHEQLARQNDFVMGLYHNQQLQQEQLQRLSLQLQTLQTRLQSRTPDQVSRGMIMHNGFVSNQ